MPVAIVGMHRSGTSMVARLLNLAGVDLGDADAMLPPTEFNLGGHWENTTVLDLNDRILEHFDGSWDHPPHFSPGWYDLPELEPLRAEAAGFVAQTFPTHGIWGWKEPRTTLTIPFWRRVVPDLRFVVCIRNPLDVAASLHTRDEMPVARATALWQLYTELALTNTDAGNRIIVHYERFFTDFDRTLTRLLDFLGLPELEAGSERTASVQAGVDATLIHHDHAFQDAVESPELATPVRLLYDGLLHHPDSIDLLFKHRPVDEPISHLMRMHAGETTARREVGKLTAVVTEQRTEIEQLEEQLRTRDDSVRLLTAQATELTICLESTAAQVQATQDALGESRAQAAESRQYAERLLGSLEQREADSHEATTRHEALVHELAVRHEDTMREMSARLAEWQDHWTQVQLTVAWRFVENIRRARRVFIPERSRLERLWFRALGRDVPRSSASGSSALPLHTVDAREEPAPESLPTIDRGELERFLESEIAMAFPPVDRPRVSIVMLTWNQAHNTYMTLHSLLAHETSVPFELIIVDNASSDETQTLLDRLENVRIERNETNLGFGPACNQGAALAQGDFICFLNNDTLSNPGWLHELVQTLDEDPGCGAAGAKLVLSNGRLQEAGSIIWRDGSTTGYGRGRDPNAPEYCYRREVDYCSAACLLVRKAIFEEVGGFDRRFAPAYYEDADLCMAVRAAGYTVVFVPEAVITHLEHASSDRSAAIALQQRNRGVFVAKWRQVLADRPLPGIHQELLARDTRANKRVLVIDDRIPEARYGSGFPRTRALLEMLAQSRYVVTYLPTADPTPVEPDTSQLQRMGIEVLHSVMNVPNRLRERRGMYEVAIVSRPTNVSYLPVVREWNPSAFVIYDAEAVFTFREALQAEVDGHPFSADQIDERIREELAPLAAADAVVTVSERERGAIQRQYPGKPINVWGHPTSVRLETSPFAVRRGALFVGYLASGPNHDALLRLLQHIMPQVYDAVGCTLTVVGSDAQPEALIAGAAAQRAVSFRGYVDSLTGLYDTSRIFVAPHRFAAGVPLKVIEAMAHGVPCVVSELLADQLGVTAGVHALVASDTDEFVAEVIRLYTDQELWTTIQQQGLRFILERYDPERMRAQLQSMIERPAADFTSATVRSAVL